MMDAIVRKRRCTEMRRDADPRGRSDAWEQVDALVRHGDGKTKPIQLGKLHATSDHVCNRRRILGVRAQHETAN